MNFPSFVSKFGVQILKEKFKTNEYNPFEIELED